MAIEDNDLLRAAAQAKSDEDVIEVVRDAVGELERVTQRLQSFLDKMEG